MRGGRRRKDRTRHRVGTGPKIGQFWIEIETGAVVWISALSDDTVTIEYALGHLRGVPRAGWRDRYRKQPTKGTDP